MTFLPSLALGLEGGVALSHLFDAVTAGEWILGTLFFGISLAILIRIIFAVLRVRSLLAKMDEDTAGFYLWAPLGGAAAVALYVNQTHHTWWQWLIGVPFGAMAIGFCLAVAYMAVYFGSIKVAEWHGWQPPRRNDKWERLEAQFKAAHEAEFRELYELEARL